MWLGHRRRRSEIAVVGNIGGGDPVEVDDRRARPARNEQADRDRRQCGEVHRDRVGKYLRSRRHGHAAGAAEGKRMVGRRIDRARRAVGGGLRHMRRADHERIVPGRVGEADARLLAAGAEPDKLAQSLVVDVLADGKDVARPPAADPAVRPSGAVVPFSNPAARAATISTRSLLMTESSALQFR